MADDSLAREVTRSSAVMVLKMYLTVRSLISMRHLESSNGIKCINIYMYIYSFHKTYLELKTITIIYFKCQLIPFKAVTKWFEVECPLSRCLPCIDHTRKPSSFICSDKKITSHQPNKLNPLWSDPVTQEPTPNLERTVTDLIYSFQGSKYFGQQPYVLRFKATNHELRWTLIWFKTTNIFIILQLAN